MKKWKSYHIIIAILCFLSILNFFLPYLRLSDKDLREDGYIVDLRMAALNSGIVGEIAQETGLAESVVYKTGEAVIKGKKIKEGSEALAATLETEISRKAEEISEIEGLTKTDFSYFSLLNLSVSIITKIKQDVISAVLSLLYMILSVVIPVSTGIKVLLSGKKQNYRFVKTALLINLALTLLGFICINAISVGALQVKKFTYDYWGFGNWLALILSFLIWLTAVIASIHEKHEGFVSWRIIAKQKQLILMTIPFILYAIIFYYAPLAGWVTAFQNFKPALPSAEQAWIGWGKFEYLFSNREFINVIRNTLAMSVINLVLSFAFSIGFALLLNEVINIHGKKFVQTVSYLPHFLSWVIATGIVNDVLSSDTGIINDMLVKTNVINSPINFFADPKYFWWIVGLANVWKETGWGSIIYLAAITSISPDLYEAASIDGAGRLKKIRHITIPGIRPTIMILLIINIGNILNAGFEVQYLLGNGLVQSVSQTIDIYVLKYGISLFDFSLGTAAGIFKSLVSIVLIFLANRFARAAGEERLF